MKSNLWFWNITRAISLMNRAWNWRDNEDKFVSIIYCIIKFYVLLSKFPPNAPDWSIPYFMAIYYSMEAHLVPPRVFLTFHWCHTQVVPLAGRLSWRTHPWKRVCITLNLTWDCCPDTEHPESLLLWRSQNKFPRGTGQSLLELCISTPGISHTPSHPHLLK